MLVAAVIFSLWVSVSLADCPEAPIQRNVVVAIFSPMREFNGHQVPLWQFDNLRAPPPRYSWTVRTDPRVLAQHHIDDMCTVSRGQLRYNVIRWMDIDEYPPYNSTLTWTDETYDQCHYAAVPEESPGCYAYHDRRDKGDLPWYQRSSSYPNLFQRYSFCEQNPNMHELWMFGNGHALWWEASTTGPGAYYTNGITFESTCNSLTHILGFNYDRTRTEMLHDQGHRMEGTMRHLYGRWDRSLPESQLNLWELYSLRDIDKPGRAVCGDTHFTPNSQVDYEMDNSRSVNSRCTDFWKEETTEVVDCHKWQCDYYQWLLWWLTQLPGAEGFRGNRCMRSDLGFSLDMNWWHWFADFEALPERNCEPDVCLDIGNHPLAVDVSTLAVLLSNWGPCVRASSSVCSKIASRDNMVGVSRLAQLLSNWGPLVDADADGIADLGCDADGGASYSPALSDCPEHTQRLGDTCRPFVVMASQQGTQIGDDIQVTMQDPLLASSIMWTEFDVSGQLNLAPMQFVEVGTQSFSFQVPNVPSGTFKSYLASPELEGNSTYFFWSCTAPDIAEAPALAQLGKTTIESVVVELEQVLSNVTEFLPGAPDLIALLREQLDPLIDAPESVWAYVGASFSSLFPEELQPPSRKRDSSAAVGACSFSFFGAAKRMCLDKSTAYVARVVGPFSSLVSNIAVLNPILLLVNPPLAAFIKTLSLLCLALNSMIIALQAMPNELANVQMTPDPPIDFYGDLQEGSEVLVSLVGTFEAETSLVGAATEMGLLAIKKMFSKVTGGISGGTEQLQKVVGNLVAKQIFAALDQLSARMETLFAAFAPSLNAQENLNCKLVSIETDSSCSIVRCLKTLSIFRLRLTGCIPTSCAVSFSWPIYKGGSTYPRTQNSDTALQWTEQNCLEMITTTAPTAAPTGAPTAAPTGAPTAASAPSPTVGTTTSTAPTAAPTALFCGGIYPDLKRDLSQACDTWYPHPPRSDYSCYIPFDPVPYAIVGSSEFGCTRYVCPLEGDYTGAPLEVFSEYYSGDVLCPEKYSNVDFQGSINPLWRTDVSSCRRYVCAAEGRCVRAPYQSGFVGFGSDQCMAGEMSAEREFSGDWSLQTVTHLGMGTCTTDGRCCALSENALRERAFPLWEESSIFHYRNFQVDSHGFSAPQCSECRGVEIGNLQFCDSANPAPIECQSEWVTAVCLPTIRPLIIGTQDVYPGWPEQNK